MTNPVPLSLVCVEYQLELDDLSAKKQDKLNAAPSGSNTRNGFGAVRTCVARVDKQFCCYKNGICAVVTLSHSFGADGPHVILFYFLIYFAEMLEHVDLFCSFEDKLDTLL